MTAKRPASLRYRLALTVYQAALLVLEPLVWRYFRKRGRGDEGYLQHWDERHGQGAVFDADVWVHAVSLGEYRSAEPAIRRLVVAGHRVIVTHATPAGRRASERGLAEDQGAGRVAIRYAPIDRRAYWQAFFGAHAPRLGLVFEMEFWPGMIEAAERSGVPLWLVNSQIPKGSFSRARKIAAILGDHPAGRATQVFAKSDRMADRFRQLGAPNVTVMGETRFDIAPPGSQVALGEALADHISRPIYTFASVVTGEEETYMNAVAALKNALIIWVPRAPEGFEATFDAFKAVGLRVARRSEAFTNALEPTVDLTDVDVLLGDSFGEMFFYLAAADVVSVGGGFVEKGVHNVIEPLALGKPVVTGPHVWTIEFPGVEAVEAGVMRVCADSGTLADTLAKLRSTGPAKAKAFHAENTGATDVLVQAANAELRAET